MSELGSIEVRRYGSSGPAVLALHGGPGAPGSAAGLALALSTHFQVLEPLQRRSGQVPLTVAQHVEDLHEIAPSPAVIIGWSWGAMLGLSYAARYPDRVSTLILVGCGTYGEEDRAAFRAALDRQLGDDGRALIAQLKARLAAEPSALARDSILGVLGAVYMRAESYALLDDDEGTNARPAPLPADDAGHAQTWSDALRLQREGTEPAAFRAITARVIMIHGDVDPHPGRATRDTLREFMPTLEYVELPRCGHEPWRERHAREPFLEAIRRVLIGGE